MHSEELTLTAASRPKKIEFQAIVFAIVLLTVLFFVLYPVVLLVFFSFTSGSRGDLQLTFSAWTAAIDNPVLIQSVINTFKVLIATNLLTFPAAILIAWILARTDLPGGELFEFLFWISFFLPSLSILLGWIMCLDPEYGLLNMLFEKLPFVEKGPFNIYSFWGIVWCHIVSHALTVKVMLLTPVFRNLDSTLEESASLCGANRFKTLIRITIPITLPALLAILLMAMIRSLQSFEVELVLGPPFNFYVYSTQVYALVGQEPPNFAGASALATIGLIFVSPLIFLQRWVSVRRQYTTISGKMKSEVVRLGKLKPFIFVFISIIVFGLTLLPLMFLGLASAMQIFGFFEIPEPWTFEHWRTVFADTSFRASVLNTIRVSLGAAVTSVLLLSLIAYFSIRSQYVGRAVLDFVSWLPFAVPGILFGLGLLYVFLETPFFRPLYGTIWLMIVASVITHMTLGVQIIKTTLLQISRDLEEAGLMSGASWLKTLLGILLPLMAPTLVLVATTAFITTARDVASVALVATAGTKTLSLLQLDYMVQGRYGPAAVISFVVVFLSTGVAIMARMMGLRLGMRH